MCKFTPVHLVVNWEDLVFGYSILISFFWTEFNCIMTDLILINKGIFEFVCVSIIDRFVFCFSAPSLTTLCKLCILENKIDVSSLPKTIRWVQFLLDSVSETTPLCTMSLLNTGKWNSSLEPFIWWKHHSTFEEILANFLWVTVTCWSRMRVWGGGGD